MSTEKKLYIIRHGTTEMNEALGRQPWGSKSFRDQLLWDTGNNKTPLLYSLVPSPLIPSNQSLCNPTSCFSTYGWWKRTSRQTQ